MKVTTIDTIRLSPDDVNQAIRDFIHSNTTDGKPDVYGDGVAMAWTTTGPDATPSVTVQIRCEAD